MPGLVDFYHILINCINYYLSPGNIYINIIAVVYATLRIKCIINHNVQAFRKIKHTTVSFNRKMICYAVFFSITWNCFPGGKRKCE